MVNNKKKKKDIMQSRAGKVSSSNDTNMTNSM